MRNGLSIGSVWEEALAFFRAEAALLLPIAFATFGVPLVALQLAAPPPAADATAVMAAGPWMIWLLPWMLGGMTGSMAISALALRPGLSVGEALRLAVARIGAGLALVALGLLAILALSIAASVVAGIEMGLRGRAGAFFAIALLGALVLFIAAIVRVLPIWAVLVDGPARPIAALRHSLALTRSGYLRLLLLLLRVVAWLAQVVTLFVLLMPVAVVFAILARVTGAQAVCDGLRLVAFGIVLSSIQALWTVYVARLYRALSNGI